MRRNLTEGRLWMVLLLLILVGSSTTVVAGPDLDIPPQAGIWNSLTPLLQFNSARRDKLVQSLRRITGLKRLDFDCSGALILGDLRQSEGGSALARAVLGWASASDDVFIIEDHFRSATVQFGQLDEGTRYRNSVNGRDVTIWRIRIDAADFRGIEAPVLVKDAFDEGFTVLHELLHALGYDDPLSRGEVGECEEVLNEIRTDLHLPLRGEYFGTFFPVASGIGTVRLRFESPIENEERTRWRTDYLFFTFSREAYSESLLACTNRGWY